MTVKNSPVLLVVVHQPSYAMINPCLTAEPVQKRINLYHVMSSVVLDVSVTLEPFLWSAVLLSWHALYWDCCFFRKRQTLIENRMTCKDECFLEKFTFFNPAYSNGDVIRWKTSEKRLHILYVCMRIVSVLDICSNNTCNYNHFINSFYVYLNVQLTPCSTSQCTSIWKTKP